MKVAVVQDWLDNVGGGEYDALVLAKGLNADLYTGHYDPDRTFPEFEELKVIETVPETLSRSGFTLSRMMASSFFMRLDFSEYDVVISVGQWSHFAAVGSDVPNISFLLSPNRGCFDLKEKVASRLPFWKRLIFLAWSGFWASCDKVAQENVDVLVAQSETVGERMRRYYGREPDALIYPPVKVKKFKPSREKDDYILLASRLAREKRINLALNVFKELPHQKLIICGGASPHDQELKEEVVKTAGLHDNIEYEGRVSDKELADLYARAKATLHLGRDEDFGLTPIESMASGTVPIAVNEGGYRETIKHRETGVLFSKPYEKNLEKTITSFDPSLFNTKRIVSEAGKYSKERFVNEFKRLVERIAK